MKAGKGQWFAIGTITDVVGLARSIFYSAKNWQDTLQSTLPGYRERIVHVYLKPEEGGLNLAMGKQTIDVLVGLGGRAGESARRARDEGAGRQVAFRSSRIIAGAASWSPSPVLKKRSPAPPKLGGRGFWRRLWRIR